MHLKSLQAPIQPYNTTIIIQSLLTAPLRYHRPSPPLEPVHPTSTQRYPSFNPYDSFVLFILLMPIIPRHCTFHLYRMPAVCLDNPCVPLIESP
uniref:Ovule protein n=1 Tax=Panagrellus redivivus TaxID=6233 RepID=A0A7E4ZX31_PANRE